MTHFVAAGSRTEPPESLAYFHKLKVLLTGVQIPRPENHSTPADAGLAFQTVRFGGAGNDDCEAWVVPARQSKGLIIAFHAYTACKSTLLPSATVFHDLGYDVLMVDFRGSGGSRGDGTTIGYREADDVLAAIQFAARRWPNCTPALYGQSMGGAAILRAIAVLGAHPAGIIIESTYDRLLSTVEDRFGAMGLPAFPLARLLVFWGGVQGGFDAFALNPAEYAQKVACPALVFQGGADPRVTDAQAYNLFEHLAGPKRYERFASAGHCGFLSSDPGRWTNDVKAFLESLRF